MTAPLTLTYDQTGFPFPAVSAHIRQRSVPYWARVLSVLALVVMLAPLLIAALPPQGRLFTAQGLPLLGFAAGYLAYRQINAHLTRTVFAKIATAPYRTGPRQLHLAADGITVTSPTSRWHYPWAHVHAIEAGPQGTALILLSPYDYEPIAATAFADTAARDAFIATATLHRQAAAKASS